MAFRRSRPHRLVPLALLALGLLLLAHLQLKTLEPPQPAAASSSSLPPARELPLSRPQAPSQAASWRPFPDKAPELRVGLWLKNVYILQADKQIFSADGWYWRNGAQIWSRSCASAS